MDLFKMSSLLRRIYLLFLASAGKLTTQFNDKVEFIHTKAHYIMFLANSVIEYLDKIFSFSVVRVLNVKVGSVFLRVSVNVNCQN